jgi:hypothetical protein
MKIKVTLDYQPRDFRAIFAERRKAVYVLFGQLLGLD